MPVYVNKIERTVELHLHNGSADRVYQLLIEETASGAFVLHFAYGRRGSRLVCKIKVPATRNYRVVRDRYNHELTAQLKQGYRSVAGCCGGVFLANSSTPAPLQAKIVPAGAFTGLVAMQRPFVAPAVAQSYLASADFALQEYPHGGQELLVAAELKEDVISITFAEPRGTAIAAPNPTLVDSLVAKARQFGSFRASGILVQNTLYLQDLLFFCGRNLRPDSFYDRYEALQVLQPETVNHAAHLGRLRTAYSDHNKQELYRDLAGGGTAYYALGAAYQQLGVANEQTACICQPSQSAQLLVAETESLTAVQSRAKLAALPANGSLLNLQVCAEIQFDPRTEPLAPGTIATVTHYGLDPASGLLSHPLLVDFATNDNIEACTVSQLEPTTA